MSDAVDTAAKLAVLEAENARLRAELDTARVAPDAAAGPRGRTGRWRTVVAVVLIVVGTLLAPVAVVSAWARVQLTDTDAFVATFASLAEDPAVQELVVDQAATAIENHVDYDELTNSIVEGIVDLGTGPRATAALQALAGPAADGLRTVVRNTIERFVASEAFETIWTESLRLSHAQAIAALQGDTDSGLQLDSSGTLSINLGPVIEEIKAQLESRGIGIAAQIPVVDVEVTIAQAAALAQIRVLYGVATAVGTWLPWVAVALLAGAVLIARRPLRMLVVVALVFAAIMAILLAGFGIAYAVLAAAIPADVVPGDALAALYGGLIERMRETAIVGIVLGLLLALVAWYSGPFEASRAIRSGWREQTAALRAAGDRRGIGTGRWGEWIGRHIRELRLLVILAASAVILFVRPLSVGLVVWTLVLALLAVVILELVQRPRGETVVEDTPDEDADTTPEDVVEDAEDEEPSEVLVGVVVEEAPTSDADDAGEAPERDAPAPRGRTPKSPKPRA
ncbi:glycerol-3-phosphate acyltransferase [Agromyces seonyuensis]|uniref:Integral membrane protein n=1 Tax=Agromyces seonyuensis TaxID=2662446 RepID=A0A6I4NVI0_9MICO|nr:glycerol-3-phosphate acyltransferase [Agromyces seonyuensis]MWB98388.1 hypothetical protein [Agromyces seonyuensis]